MLNADEIRAIVREELREAFRMLATEADRFPGYETDTSEDTAARMLSQVAESTEDKLRHTPTCKLRIDGQYYWDCDCGAKEA